MQTTGAIEREESPVSLWWEKQNWGERLLAFVWCLVSQRILSNLQYLRCVGINKILGTWQALIPASLKPVSTKDRQAWKLLRHPRGAVHAAFQCNRWAAVYHRALISPNLYKNRTNNAHFLPEQWDRMKNPYYVQHPYVSFLNSYFLSKAGLWATTLCCLVCLSALPGAVSWPRLDRWLWGSE